MDRYRWSAIVVLGVVAAAAMWRLMIVEVPDTSGAVWAHQGIAAWAQAICTLGAVAVAIWVPAKIERDKRDAAERDRQLQARALANDIFVPVNKLMKAAEKQIQEVGQHYGDIIEEWEFKKLMYFQLSLPGVLLENMPRYYILGSHAAIPLIQVISLARQHNEFIAELAGGLIDGMIDVERAPDANLVTRIPRAILELREELISVLKVIADRTS